MYAVVATGGKQYKVEEGQVLEVERVGAVGSDVDLRPVLVVDGSTVISSPTDLANASRRRWGHRQTLARIEITGISKG